MSYDKIRDNRLRRMAARQGMTLTRSRRRDPQARDYGMYWLTDTVTGEPRSKDTGMTMEGIATMLKNGVPHAPREWPVTASQHYVERGQWAVIYRAEDDANAWITGRDLALLADPDFAVQLPRLLAEAQDELRKAS
jgi:hypothetical protein